jgi:tight adherence protein C
MAEAIALATFLLLTGGITFYGFRVYARPARILKQLREPPQPVAPQKTDAAEAEQQGVLIRTLRQVGEKVPISPDAAGAAKRYLIAAGFRSESAIRVLYGIKAALCVVLPLLAWGPVYAITVKPGLRLAFLGAMACLGWFGPGLVLEAKVKRRQETIRLSLPDALDLIVVCVEAGHGLDQALMRVTQELRSTHKEICEEFSLLNLEMRAGKRRTDALRNLAERAGEPELRKLVAIMIQADRFGTSIGDSLRTHADFMRVKRRQDAEERANKVGVKLVFPIFFCILPSMFVVTAGPGVLAIINNLLPALKQAGGH